MRPKEELQILTAVKNSEIPVGATFLSVELELPPATVGRRLLILEKKGFLEKISNKGRKVTEAGLEYMQHQEQLNDKLSVAKTIMKNANAGSLEGLYEIMAIRMLIEPHSAEQACKNISVEGLHRLEAIHMENVKELKDGGIGNEQDLEFHLTIAKESGNKTLLQILQLILTQNNAYTQFSSSAPRVVVKQVREHTAILEAIKNGDAEGASKVMYDHLERVITDIKKHHSTAASKKKSK